MTWVTVPPSAGDSHPRTWTLLNGNADVEGHLTGFYHGDGPAKIGVRTWGGGWAPPELRAAIAKALGGGVLVPAVEVQMRGYGAALGQPADDYAALRSELKRVFPDTPVRLRSCTPMSNTGLQRAVYTLVLEGIPEGWSEHPVRCGDSRVPDKMWARL